MITAMIAALIWQPELRWLSLLYLVSMIAGWIWQRNHSYGQLRWKQVVVVVVIEVAALSLYFLIADRALDALETSGYDPLTAIVIIFFGVTSGCKIAAR